MDFCAGSIYVLSRALVRHSTSLVGNTLECASKDPHQCFVSVYLHTLLLTFPQRMPVSLGTCKTDCLYTCTMSCCKKSFALLLVFTQSLLAPILICRAHVLITYT